MPEKNFSGLFNFKNSLYIPWIYDSCCDSSPPQRFGTVCACFPKLLKVWKLGSVHAAPTLFGCCNKLGPRLSFSKVLTGSFKETTKEPKIIIHHLLQCIPLTRKLKQVLSCCCCHSREKSVFYTSEGMPQWLSSAKVSTIEISEPFTHTVCCKKKEFGLFNFWAI